MHLGYTWLDLWAQALQCWPKPVSSGPARACTTLSAGQGRQASVAAEHFHAAHPQSNLQVQVVLAVARGVGRHLRFLEAVLHIRHMRYYIIFALVRTHSVLGDTRTDSISRDMSW